MVLILIMPSNTSAQTDSIIQLGKSKEFFKEAKFGMFIHWGVYSILGGEYQGKEWDSEWIQLHGRIPADDYEKIAQTFNPVSFDAEKWMKIAKKAGMKYIVFTSKHHDGFCMFKSNFTN